MGTFTQNMLAATPAPGDPAQLNAWGTMENTGRDIFDAALGGSFSLSVAGSANVVLTSTAGAPDQSRYMHYIFTGVLTGNIQVLWPASVGRTFSVINSTTGAFTLSLGANNGAGVAAGATVTIPRGVSAICYSDGTNVVVRQLGFVGTQPGSLTVSGGFSDGTSGAGFTSSGFGIVSNFNVQGISSNVGSPTPVSISVIARTNGVILNDGGTAWLGISDETLKTPFTPFIDALSKLISIKTGTGRFLTDPEDKSRSFMSAQDVQRVLPEAVSVYDNPKNPDDPFNGKLLLDPSAITPLILAALHIINGRLSALEAKS